MTPDVMQEIVDRAARILAEEARDLLREEIASRRPKTKKAGGTVAPLTRTQ